MQYHAIILAEDSLVPQFSKDMVVGELLDLFLGNWTPFPVQEEGMGMAAECLGMAAECLTLLAD